jgi:arylsulfatase A-like enzyme
MNDTVENVLLLTYDSLRYDVWNEMRPSLTAGPQLETAGTSLDRAFATGPGTTPSFPGMLTGTLPLSYHGLGPLTEDRPRVAAELRARGLTTAGFHSNPFLSTHFNYDVGFDEFRDYQNPLMGVATKIFPRGIEINNPRLKRVDEVVNLTGLIKSAYRHVQGKARPYVSAEVITDDAVEWLESTSDPFFCWAHYMDVHHPCHPPREYRAAYGVEDVDSGTVSELYSALIGDSASLTDDDLETMAALYRAAIAYVDDQISRLVQVLKREDRFEETLIVLTSDHGELFGEYGQYGKPERMYDELIRVPLVVVNSPPSLELPEDELVSLLDLPPLFHEALGTDVPVAYEGIVPGSESRSHVIAEHEVDGDRVVGARSDAWLYEVDEILGECRLFETGAMQQVDPDAPDAARIRAVVEDRLQYLRAGTAGDELPSAGDSRLDDDVEARLEDLGYR